MDIIHEKLIAYAIGIAIGTVISIPLIVWSRRLAKKRRTIQNQIKHIKTLRAEYDSSFPVRYFSEEKFKKFWKFAGEATGLIFISRGLVTFSGVHNNGSDLGFRFTAEDSTLNWIGAQTKLYWGYATVYWLELSNSNHRYYFTSDTGAFVFGSEEGTRKLFTKIKDAFS